MVASTRWKVSKPKGSQLETLYELGKQSRQLRVLDVGGNDGLRARDEFYPGSEVEILDLKHGWDVMKVGLPNGAWDIILANHFIEHITDPDFFLDECRRVMSETTVLDIGTPNLCAWFNRLLFLFGYVPHSVELSRRYNIGKAFGWNNEGLGGHIYVYSLRALLELLKHHGFKVISVTGERSTYPAPLPIKWLDGFLTSLSPHLASAIRVKCQLGS